MTEPSPQTIEQSPSPVYHAKFLNISYPHQSINILKNTIFSLTNNTASDLGVPVRLHCLQLSMTSTLEKNNQIDLLLLDFSKAFDTVPHNRLLHKLDHYRIRASTHLWIKKILTNRTQEVLVEGCKSGQVHVSSGVPQGTVLAPSSSYSI